jgi:ATP-dependent DNA ligase
MLSMLSGQSLIDRPLQGWRELRWGEGLTAADMARCRWLRPQLVSQIEFVEWTPTNHLRHARYAGLRGDKNPREVTREQPIAIERAGSSMTRRR